METWVEYVGDRPHGRNIRFYDIEQSDEEEVIEKIKEQLIGYEEEDYPETVTITMVCPITDDDVDIEITVKEYL